MTRAEAIAEIQANLSSLDDERVETMLAMLKTWSGQSVYDTLSGDERAKIDRALDRLDAGESVPSEKVFSNLAAKLRAAGA